MSKEKKQALIILVIGAIVLYLLKNKLQAIGTNLSFGKIDASKNVAGQNCTDLRTAIATTTSHSEAAKALGFSLRQYDALRNSCGLGSLRQPNTTPEYLEYMRLWGLIKEKMDLYAVLGENQTWRNRLQLQADRKGITYTQMLAVSAVDVLWHTGESSREKGKIFEKILSDKYGLQFDIADIM